MLNQRKSALSRLLEAFNGSDDELLDKHSPKAVSVEVVKPLDEDDEGGAEVPPALLKKVMDLIGPEAIEKLAGGGLVNEKISDQLTNPVENAREASGSDLEPEKMAAGGVVRKGRFDCQGCGKDIASCRCDKMAEGGLVEDEPQSAHEAQMARRQAQREAERAAETEAAMEDLARAAGGEESEEIAEGYSKGGMVRRSPRKSRYYGKKDC